MKTARDGVRYDTAKAVKLGEARAPCPENDLSYWEAGLYRKPRTGQYFLAGRGGALTRWRGEERIFPLTREEAAAWAGQYLTESPSTE